MVLTRSASKHQDQKKGHDVDELFLSAWQNSSDEDLSSWTRYSYKICPLWALPHISRASCEQYRACCKGGENHIPFLIWMKKNWAQSWWMMNQPSNGSIGFSTWPTPLVIKHQVGGVVMKGVVHGVVIKGQSRILKMRKQLQKSSYLIRYMCYLVDYSNILN